MERGLPGERCQWMWRGMQRRDRLRRGCGGSTSGCAEGPDCRREKREVRGPKVWEVGKGRVDKTEGGAGLGTEPEFRF